MSAQLLLPIRAGPRRFHPTGLQTSCVGCAAAGIDKQGLPRADGGPALCMPCWHGSRAREQRAALSAVLADTAAADFAECEVCGQVRLDPECFRCGWVWLAELRQQFAAEQQQARLAELAESEAEFARMAQCTEAELAVSRLVGLVDRLRNALDASAVGGGRGRPVELLADAYTLMPPVGGRGRPPAWPRVAAVLALDADYRSGRRARPGHADTAALTGLQHTATTKAWQDLAAAGWVERTEVGGLATLAQRRALGVHRLRAEFDVRPLHTAPAAARAPFRAAALQVFAELLAAALELLAGAERELDEVRAAAATATGWDEHVRRARLRAAAERTEGAVTQRINGNPREGDRKCSSSGSYLGLPPASEKLSEVGGGARPYGRWAKIAPGEAGPRPHRVQPPRKLEGLRAKSPPRRRPVWATPGLYGLARALRDGWAWLAAEPVARIAATIGPEVGERWTVAGLETWLAARLGRPMLAEPYRPLSYLRAMLREARGQAAPPLDRSLTLGQWAKRVQEAQGIALHEQKTARQAAWESQAAAAGSPAAAADLWPEVARPGSIHRRE